MRSNGRTPASSVVQISRRRGAGRPPSEAVAPAAVAPAALKAAVVKMMGEGIGGDIIVGYVRTVAIEPPLTPDDMIDWKQSGIPDAVLRAAVSR